MLYNCESIATRRSAYRHSARHTSLGTTTLLATQEPLCISQDFRLPVAPIRDNHSHRCRAHQRTLILGPRGVSSMQAPAGEGPVGLDLRLAHTLCAKRRHKRSDDDSRRSRTSLLVIGVRGRLGQPGTSEDTCTADAAGTILYL